MEELNPSSGREEDLNAGTLDYKSSALTTRPRHLNNLSKNLFRCIRCSLFVRVGYNKHMRHSPFSDMSGCFIDLPQVERRQNLQTRNTIEKELNKV